MSFPSGDTGTLLPPSLCYTGFESVTLDHVWTGLSQPLEVGLWSGWEQQPERPIGSYGNAAALCNTGIYLPRLELLSMLKHWNSIQKEGSPWTYWKSYTGVAVPSGQPLAIFLHPYSIGFLVTLGCSTRTAREKPCQEGAAEATGFSLVPFLPALFPTLHADQA